MKILFDHLERVKQKPHDVRRQIAFTTAGSLATLIGVVWLGTSLSSGAFMIQGSTFADATDQGSTVVASAPSDNTSLVGSAAAAQATTQPAHIEIVNAATTTPAAQPEKDIIPF